MKDEHQYDSLKDVDDHSESSTEVEELEPQSEKTRRRRNSSRGVWKKVKGCRWMIDTVLLLVIFGLLVERIWEDTRSRSRDGSHRYEFTGDLTGFAPQCEYLSFYAMVGV
jgi:hypothetical protein